MYMYIIYIYIYVIYIIYIYIYIYISIKIYVFDKIAYFSEYEFWFFPNLDAQEQLRLLKKTEICEICPQKYTSLC